ncbi:MAG: type IV pilus twitching motility protein PilT [Armatimonadota bacterium]
MNKSSTETASVDLYDLLVLSAQHKASDLHLTEHEPPILRIDGKLRRMKLPTLARKELKDLIYAVLSDAQQVAFERNLELDFALALPGMERFRVNVHQQLGSIEAAFRRVPLTIPTLDQLGLPVVVKQLARMQSGLVLVTGPTGMGKSTTLAAMVDQINSERECLIITIEDPVEIVHTNMRSVIKQREVFGDTHSFVNALRHVLRQDPDVIVVGEMRDLETIATTLTAAETGHLVLATLHTPDAPQTIQRIVDVFPSTQQVQVRMQLAESLNGVISQQLLPKASGQGRALATEVLLATPAVRNIIREDKVQQLPSVMETGRNHGMCTMDRSLAELVRSGRVAKEIALAKARDPELVKQLMR